MLVYLIFLFVSTGAGEEVRTLDIYLGKVMLYQLSYARIKLTYLLVLSPRIELRIHPYQGCVIPLNYES